ncbi:MAG: M24 family metallopeptidase [Kosmotoga sp.]|nr:MAG: M24 family metallopeptidase [Kosmotoga sp.]
MDIRRCFEERINKLKEIILKNRSKSLLLSRTDNFSWLTFGARGNITLDMNESVASILITPKSQYLLVDNIEKERLFKEEIPEELHDYFEVVVYDWWQGEYRALSKITTSDLLISDTGRYETKDVYEEISPLRYVLSEIEVDSYKKLGTTCDKILYEEMQELTPEMTELKIQGKIYSRLAGEGIEPLLTIVFGEESSTLYRHNLSRDVPVGKKVFLSICARKKGLVLSTTRSILFEKDEKIINQHRDNCYIDAVAIAGSKPGRKIKEVFNDIISAYNKTGSENEWQLHHQGGLAGYNSREIKAASDEEYELTVNNAVAWNPTITGTKSEDTAIIKENKVDIISYPYESQWPGVDFEMNGEIIRRPDIMIF